MSVFLQLWKPSNARTPKQSSSWPPYIDPPSVFNPNPPCGFFMGDNMATHFKCLWGLSFLLSLYFIHSTSTSHVYIVYLGLNRIRDPLLTTKQHLQLLSNVFAGKEEAEKSMIYSYKHSFSGFSAMLNSSQANTLASMEGVISVFESKRVKLHTTRSWDFMGLTLDKSGETAPEQACGNDIIVGVIDTGIWPESKSFKGDAGMGPVPSSWKGKCEGGEMFDNSTSCNRKLIGARYYLKAYEKRYGKLNTSGGIFEYRSPRDFLNHGTHTASTAVGSIVRDASFLGLGHGIARGGAPRARLAVYKVCWSGNTGGHCEEADIMAAFDDALDDGVDVISVSIGITPPLGNYFETFADIGSFHAMQRGVSVVFSAGNDGPDPSLVTNVAPWSLCVAASTIDRTFPTQILVDNKLSIMGEGLISEHVKGKLTNNISNYFTDGVCRSWNGKSAKGVVLVCFSTLGKVSFDEAAEAARVADASGLIYVAPLTRQLPEPDILPIVHVDISQGTLIHHYLSHLSPSRRLPKVQIFPTRTVIKKSPAPSVAYYSSRGPSSLSPDILKPDVSAPGVNILAAFANGSTSWLFQSGTSMSCPHVSGVVALIKSKHPHWSPAAIKSALMTTAYTVDTTQDKILAGGSMKVADSFDIGAGHINPLKAMNPGLVYDMNTGDYILFLCNIGYTKDMIKKMVICPSGTDISCPKKAYVTTSNLNYPSITVSNLQSTMTVKRTVRNVGKRRTTIYFASVVNPDGVEVSIWPRILIFSIFREEVSYYVTLCPLKKSQGRYDFGEIVWSDGFHSVRTPLVVLVNNTAADHYFSANSTSTTTTTAHHPTI